MNPSQVDSLAHATMAHGLIQLAVWIFYKEWWVLPAFGIFVGYATNWLAINMIFRPLHPRKFLGWTIHGLFLRRQREVAATWCRLVSTEIITLQHIIYAMLYGVRAERAKRLIQRHIRPVADRVLESYAPAGQVMVDRETLGEIRDSVGEKAVAVSTDAFDHWPFNRDRAKRAEQLLRERMEGLPSDEFQDLLRPCFQEDELKLILTGEPLPAELPERARPGRRRPVHLPRRDGGRSPVPGRSR